MKTILIATDGSEPAGQALDVAIDLARQTGATLRCSPCGPSGQQGAPAPALRSSRSKSSTAPSTSPRPPRCGLARSASWPRRTRLTATS